MQIVCGGRERCVIFGERQLLLQKSRSKIESKEKSNDEHGFDCVSAPAAIQAGCSCQWRGKWAFQLTPPATIHPPAGLCFVLTCSSSAFGCDHRALQCTACA